MYSYARVFPLPVTASTTTSEFFMNMGMAACCTGVVFTKPMESTASRIHSDKDGVKAPKVRSILGWGAMIEFKIGRCLLVLLESCDVRKEKLGEL